MSSQPGPRCIHLLRCMPGQGVSVDQALGSGSDGSPATLGLCTAPATTRGTGPQLGHPPPDPLLGLVRRTLCAHRGGTRTGDGVGRQRARGVCVRVRVRPACAGEPRRRGLLGDNRLDWPWGSSACRPGLECRVHTELVRRRPGHRARRSPARSGGCLDAHRDALGRHDRRGSDSGEAGRPTTGCTVIGHWAGDPQTWPRSPRRPGFRRP